MRDNTRICHSGAGFTLMEMMAVIVAASIVTLAATTLMLFGLRANSNTIGAMKRQNTARLLMETLENLSTGGSIASVETGLDKNGTDDTADDENYWEISDAAGNVLYSYVSETATIYQGPRPDTGIPVPAVTLLENVISFYADMSDNGVLTFSIETEDQTYTSSVYCRNKVEMTVKDEVMDDLDDTIIDAGKEENVESARVSFLKTLANQYKLAGGGVNSGIILDASKKATGHYYSEWYINPRWYTVTDSGYKNSPGWNAQTPWCACFLSWGLNEVQNMVDSAPEDRSRVLENGSKEYYWYASVDDFVRYFENGSKTGADYYWMSNVDLKAANAYNKIRPGDLIVFDWNLDNDPSHIGAVLLVEGDRVYTIEGNTSNRVGVRSYKLSDPRILGYGVIDWAPSAS